jgi:hypothetical protein
VCSLQVFGCNTVRECRNIHDALNQSPRVGERPLELPTCCAWILACHLSPITRCRSFVVSGVSCKRSERSNVAATDWAETLPYYPSDNCFYFCTFEYRSDGVWVVHARQLIPSCCCIITVGPHEFVCNLSNHYTCFREASGFPTAPTGVSVA